MPQTPDTPTPPDLPAEASPEAHVDASVPALPPADDPEAPPEAQVDASAQALPPADAPPAAPAAARAAPAAPAAPAAAPLSPAACADLLKQHFPALFGGQPKPLKLRIQADIAQRAPGVFSKATMSAFFRRYTGSTGYLIALGKASQRFDLDGQPAGELSDEHRQLARDELARRRQVTREREQQTHAQQQAQQAEQMQARQARLALLRDFERTTLTLANFCALKGLTPEALTPLLDAARKEAADAPPPALPRPLDDRRGPPGAARGDRSAHNPGLRPPARPGERGPDRSDDRANDRHNARPTDRATDRPTERQTERPNTGAGTRGPIRPNDRANRGPNAGPNAGPGDRGGPGRPGGRPTGR